MWWAVVGAVLKGGSKIAQGVNSSKAKRLERIQMQKNAREDVAVGSRSAYEIRRQSEIMKSNARAIMAGMGGSTTDAGAIEQISKIDSTMRYNALSAMYDAQSKADDWKFKSRISRWQGKQDKKAGVIGAITEGMSMFGGMSGGGGGASGGGSGG